MKKFFLFLIIGLTFFSLQLCKAGAVTIADWTFENSYLTSSSAGTNSPFISSDSGSAGGLVWGHHSDYKTSFGYVTGNGSVNAFDADHWNVGDYFEFETSTLGFNNTSISFDQYRSGTGPANWDFEYSIDGSQFTKALTYSVASSPMWVATTYHSIYTFTLDLSSIAILNDETNVFFRIIADSGSGGTAGASRMDNFIVSGTPVPEPAAVAVMMLCGMSAFVFGRRRR